MFAKLNHYRNFNDRNGAPPDQESIFSGAKRLSSKMKFYEQKLGGDL